MLWEEMFKFNSSTATDKLLHFHTEWPHLGTPCLWEKITIFMHIGFLGILLCHLVQRGVTSLFKHQIPKATADTSMKNSPGRRNYSLTCKATIACSIFLLAIHAVIPLMMMLKNYGGNTQCGVSSKGYVVLSESLQFISWSVSLFAIFRVINKRYTKFPSLLRFWWLCSFFLSSGHTASDIYTIIKKHGVMNMLDYGNCFSLIALTCLMGFAFLGKTGIAFALPDGITDPLLSGKTEQISGSGRECLYGKASLLQLITFSWLNPLFVIGFKKPLDQGEVPDVHINDSAEFLSQCFDEKLRLVKERDQTTTPSIYKAIFLFTRRKAAVNAIFAVTSAMASYVGPYLISDFVNFLSTKKSSSLRRGYLLALGFLGAKLVETIAQRQWIFGARQLGLRLKTSLTSQIYKKGLILSSQSRQSHTSGEIINYMSVDVQRMSEFIWYLNIIWMLPIQVSLAMYVLHTNLGLGSVAALAATLTVMFSNIPITRVQKAYQSKIMQAKDDRMRSTSEVLRNMKILKLQAWDCQFLNKLEGLRKIEYDWLWKSQRLGATSTFIFWGAPTFISVVTFGACVLMEIPLTAGSVLSALATFRMLQDPIFSLPDLLNVIAQGKVSADRVASYLQEEEIKAEVVEFVPRDHTEFDVEISKGQFCWDLEMRIPTLDKIQLQVKRGMKVAICGTVGSGKSSLLSCILGEMQRISGTVKISGTKAYVPQSPWILTGNIRDNILFGNPYDNLKYQTTVEACALVKDFELFASGDLTEIGERGINMSGGQKQRIQIARAVYQDADIYLFDDPFSAVDAHTGTQLFNECLLGILKDKTILYVTHQVEFLPMADLVLVMQNGRIAQAGTFEELLKQNIGFEVLVGAHSQALESILTVTSVSRPPENSALGAESNVDTTSNSQLLLSKHESDHKISPEITEKGGKLTQDEEREKGSIGKEVYWAYLTSVKGGALVPLIVLAQSTFQVLQIGSNYWMAWACPNSSDDKPMAGIKYVLFVYTLLAVGSSLCVLVRAMLVAVVGLLTSQKLFTDMLQSVLHAPMSFFDSTPTGRILNRASTDQSVADMEIAIKLGWCAFSVIQIVGTIAVMSQVAWEVFAIIIPVMAVCIWYQQYYLPTARELARLTGIQISPILHHFSESLSGAATIRAFDQAERFYSANLELINNYSRPRFHNISAMEWLSFRLNQLSNFVFAFSLILLVSLPEGIIDPSIAGLAITYGINLNILQATVIWNICNAENQMISIERILQYSRIPSEAPLLIEDCRPPDSWPDNGTISFKNLQIRYAEHFPPVLKNITCTIPGRKKVGIVGRTGSGKSTLIQAIFRIVEPTEGSIIIDKVDTSKIGLHDLRSRLSIIPQDPTMFEGTIRGNIDPLGQYSDFEIWKALYKCQLGHLVRAKENKLDSEVVENGENWSVGQRQLFCLGRALIKKSSILVLDEATASVDSATDGEIQKIISQEFKDQTIVTIAHRIHTVIDSDLILVLSDGRIAEYDTPMKLLGRENSFFSKLIKEYSKRSQNFSSSAKQET